MSMSKGPLVRPFCLYLFGLGIIPCHMFHKSLFMINADNVFIYDSQVWYELHSELQSEYGAHPCAAV